MSKNILLLAPQFFLTKNKKQNRFFFFFGNTKPYGRKKIKRHLLWKYITDALQKIPCILLGKVSTKVVQRLAKFQILNFCHFLSFSLTWDHMVEQISNDILPESARQICSQKCMHTPRYGLYRSCIKNCEILNFEFLACFFNSFYLDF